MQNLSKIKLLEDLKEEEFKLSQELKEKKKGISEDARERIIDKAFEEFKTFFEGVGFKAQSSGQLSSSYTSLLVSYKNASYSLWYINCGLHVKHGIDGSNIFSVDVIEKIGNTGKGNLATYGSSKLDTDIELKQKEIESLKQSLLNVDQLVCVYRDSQSGANYESFTKLLEMHFK